MFAKNVTFFVPVCFILNILISMKPASLQLLNFQINVSLNN